MPERITTVVQNGLTYTLRVHEVDGQFFLDVTVEEGQMHLNAVYVADDDFSGDSAGLGGPLNMNGARLEGEAVQWDDAIAINRPGLGHRDFDPDTFLQAGDTFTVPLNISSIDDADIIGIRATSTSTPEGSIKGVTAMDPPAEEPPEDPPGEGESYDKLFFVVGDNPEFGEFGVAIFRDLDAFQQGDPDAVPNPFNDAFLPEGSEGTLDDYLEQFRITAAERNFEWEGEFEIIRVYQLIDGELIEVLTLDPAEFLDPMPLPTVAVEDEDAVPELDDSEDESAPAMV